VLEWGSGLATIIVGLAGFGSAAVIHIFFIGRHFGAIDKRLEALERSELKMTDVLIGMAQSKTEVELLSKRLDDVQHYGSHKLAEVLEAIRGQIMYDFKERFDFLQREIEKRVVR